MMTIARRSPTPGRKVLYVVLIVFLLLATSFFVWQLTTDSSSDASSSDSTNSTGTSDSIPHNSQLSDIRFDTDKINFYLFWGNGCIHCEHLFDYLAEIWPEYSQYINFYAFEIWDNQDNGQIEDYFLSQLGEPAGDRSTPTFIIGDQIFHGFSDSTKAEITNTITDKYAHRDQIKDLSGVLDLEITEQSSNSDAASDANS